MMDADVASLLFRTLYKIYHWNHAKKETDYFTQRRIFLDRKSGRALLFALRPNNFNRLLSRLGAQFTPDGYCSNAISFLMFLILKSILNRELEFEPWPRPFERYDTEFPPPSAHQP